MVGSAKKPRQVGVKDGAGNMTEPYISTDDSKLGNNQHLLACSARLGVKLRRVVWRLVMVEKCQSGT